MKRFCVDNSSSVWNLLTWETRPQDGEAYDGAKKSVNLAYIGTNTHSTAKLMIGNKRQHEFETVWFYPL